MALAGDHEVIIPIQPQLDGLAQLVCRYRRPHRQMTGLGFLAAKATAHAAAFHPHGVAVQPQRMGHPMLHFAGMLGAAVNQPLVLFLWQHIGNLAFQVKVFLPTHFQRAGERVAGVFERRTRITPAHMHAGAAHSFAPAWPAAR